MADRRTKVAQGTSVAAIILAIAGAVGNYYQAQAAKESGSYNARKVAEKTIPEVNLLMDRVDRLEDRLFRVEGRLLDVSSPVLAPVARLSEETGMDVVIVDEPPPLSPVQTAIDMDELVEDLR